MSDVNRRRAAISNGGTVETFEILSECNETHEATLLQMSDDAKWPLLRGAHHSFARDMQRDSSISTTAVGSYGRSIRRDDVRLLNGDENATDGTGAHPVYFANDESMDDYHVAIGDERCIGSSRDGGHVGFRRNGNAYYDTLGSRCAADIEITPDQEGYKVIRASWDTPSYDNIDKNIFTVRTEIEKAMKRVLHQCDFARYHRRPMTSEHDKSFGMKIIASSQQTGRRLGETKNMAWITDRTIVWIDIMMAIEGRKYTNHRGVTNWDVGTILYLLRRYCGLGMLRGRYDKDRRVDGLSDILDPVYLMEVMSERNCSMGSAYTTTLITELIT